MFWRISLVLTFCCSVQAAHIINNAGRKIDGVQISAEKDGSVTLITSSGQTMTFLAGQYRSASADRPKELDIAAALIEEGSGDKAVPFLLRAKKRCRFLAWDQQAIQMLADWYFDTGQFEKAAEQYLELDDQSVSQNRKRLRTALLEGGKTRQLLKLLNEDIRSGERDAAAQAYLMRGRLRVENGDQAGGRRDWQKVQLFFRAQKESVEEAERLLKENE